MQLADRHTFGLKANTDSLKFMQIMLITVIQSRLHIFIRFNHTLCYVRFLNMLNLQ